MKKRVCHFISFIIVLTVFISSYLLISDAASFESQISSFPESYRVHLRELHKIYPNWNFVAVNTGLDWYDAVKNESDLERSAVPDGASKLCKSHAPGYYFSDTNSYKQTDAGWVNASPDTVAYFLDPRNFLNESDIFQFELLSFSSSISVNDVETILKGTFMYNTNITYYDTDGVLKKTTTKYSQCIYDAGKSNNVNPCFLASKIKNEICTGGGNPSGSVSGKYSGYEGYYNFFNIGAYAGTSPISNGLKYASTAGSYGRPWNTPQKSINGGAQFLAQSYIAKGQDTGYFQKFNVAPGAASKPYTHQYMSNVSGADSQGNSTYSSYKAEGLLSLSRTFSIPVYKNMPGADSQATDFRLLDTYNQTAYPTTALNVRTDANTSASVIVTVRANTKVTVLSKCRNTSTKYSQHLYYPYWYYITFTQDGKSYTGYAVADYFNIENSLNVNKGSILQLTSSSLGTEKPTLYTWDTSYLTIDSDFKVKAVKSGTAYLWATTSNGGYDYIKINIGSYSNSSLAVSGFSANSSSSGTTFSWNCVSGASGYDLIVNNGSNVKYTKTITSSSTVKESVSSLKSIEGYNAKLRAFKYASNGNRLNGEFSVINKISSVPDKVKNLYCTDVSTSSFTLKWDSVSNSDGYEILKRNKTTGEYELFKTVSKNSRVFTNITPGATNLYKVRAFRNDGTAKIYGELSSSAEGYTYKSVMSLPNKISVKETAATVSWASVSGANKYYAYKYDESKNMYILSGESATLNYTFNSLSAGKTYSFLIEAVSAGSGTETKISGVKFEINTLPAKVTGLKEVSSTGYKARISWNKTEGAASYQIYVKGTDSNFSFMKETSDTSYIISGLSPMGEKTVKVRAVVTNYGVKSYGTFSEPFTVYTGPAKVTGVTLSDTTYNSITIKWNALKDAGGYNIYSVSSDGTKKLISTTSKTILKIKSLSANTEYSFIVTGLRAGQNGNVTGSDSTLFKTKTTPEAVKGIKSTGHTTKRYTLSWNACNGADGYFIYRYDSATKKYVKLSDTKKTSLTYKNLYSAKKDYYKISAYIIIGKKKFEGKLSSSYSVSTLPKNPTSLSVKMNSDGSATASWKSAERTSDTRVYLYNDKTGKWSALGFAPGNSFTIAAKYITSNKRTVKVCSYVKAGDTRYYSSGATIRIP